MSWRAKLRLSPTEIQTSTFNEHGEHANRQRHTPSVTNCPCKHAIFLPSSLASSLRSHTQQSQAMCAHWYSRFLTVALFGVVAGCGPAIKIIDRPIPFSAERVQLTR
ncbi:MAG: hypothetical protein ONB49_16940, partial [candidate division KSB1 bacterium]|nr:hypothetical protein [candidate division KSB1 bacterium]